MVEPSVPALLSRPGEAARVAERSLNTDDKKLVRTFSKRLGACLKDHRNKGVVRSLKAAGSNLLWEVIK